MQMNQNTRTKNGLIAALSGIALASFAFVGAPPAAANPTGIDYQIDLDGYLLPNLDLEGHSGEVTFDGIPELVPLDAIPPGLSGNDLIVTETVTPILPSKENITIWLEGQVPGETFPTPGAPLFENASDLDTYVFFNVHGLYWANLPGASAQISNIELSLTFPGDQEISIEPFFTDMVGSGSEADPLSLLFMLDAADFDNSNFGSATDLHLSFDIEHTPEPSTLLLLGTTLLAMASFPRKAKHSDN